MLGMVLKRHIVMRQDGYKVKYYTKTEAKEILNRNAKMLNDQAIASQKARTGVADIKAAKELGMTLSEYMKMVG